jgi:DNA-binding MurR/RpiR family transcriptional regulator
MDEQALSAAIGRFVKSIGFSAQRELEKALRRELANGKLRRGEIFTTAVTLSSEKVDLDITIFSKIEL